MVIYYEWYFENKNVSKYGNICYYNKNGIISKNDNGIFLLPCSKNKIKKYKYGKKRNKNMINYYHNIYFIKRTVACS